MVRLYMLCISSKAKQNHVYNIFSAQILFFFSAKMMEPKIDENIPVSLSTSKTVVVVAARNEINTYLCNIFIYIKWWAKNTRCTNREKVRLVRMSNATMS